MPKLKKMELKAKFVKLLDFASGEGKNGVWKKQEFLVETGDKYPKNVKIVAWGEDVIDSLKGFTGGDDITAHIDIESREYKEKYYTDVKAWKIEGGSQKAPKPQEPKESLAEVEDDLPF